MAYLDQGMPVERKKAALGVIAIHAVMGTVLITGLSTVVTLGPEPTRIEGRNIEVKLDPLPPPPKPDDVTTEIITPTAPKPYTPPTRLDINQNDNSLSTTSELTVDTDTVTKTVLSEGTKPLDLPTFTPPEVLYDAVAAKPRNNPAQWVSDRDYRSIWINKNMTGVARFTVTIGTDGRVQSCRITQSTGHDALDTATCDLVTKRARFEAARDTARNKVTGTYSNAIKWELPD